MFQRVRDRAGVRPSIGLALCASAVLTATVGCTGSSGTADGADRSTDTAPPNILMVLMDDLGYTDLGAYGGKISTPVIDALANEGTLFTNFHANPLCAPTRAALMTGQDPHRVGLGTMDGGSAPGVSTATPGYRGSLEGDFTGIAEVLGRSDYDTFQVGKWHLGSGPGQNPRELGFDKNFTIYEGGGSHFADALRLAPGRSEPIDQVTYERNGDRIVELPEDFYSTDAYTDEMLQMIDGGSDSDRPFFGYLAYTAPHDPLHTPDTDAVDKYLDIYLENNDYNELREERIDELVDRGLIGPDVATRWPAQTPDWDTLTAEQRFDLAHRLAVYSAMIERVDTQLGRIVAHLKDNNEYDNTLIMVASDNGAAGASRQLYLQAPDANAWMNENYPLIGEVDAYGKPGSFPVLGLPNAQVSSGPYFHVKGTVYEGGTRAPLIVKTPNDSDDRDDGAPRIVDTFAHVSDLYPTFADYGKAPITDTDVLQGDSAKPLLDGLSEDIGDDRHGLELFGERAFRDGDSKLVFATPGNSGTGQYALYDLSTDPGETTDLAAQNPVEVQRLSDLWDQYAEENNVIAVDFATVNAAGEKSAPLYYTPDWAR